ncbi:MAG: UDP-N-acetylglucosamine--N-acetylmuramyl-(pentapeptide) pyrophosphoryl-undecaprenol N-acetylglucosamine transferase [Pseudomonadota bacterium]
MTQSQTFIMSAGGTGGHMFPALALADYLGMMGHHVHIATDRRGLRFIPASSPYAVHTLAADTLRAGVLGKIMGLLWLMFGVVQALFLLLKTRPAAVVGFGGYPSFPAVMAAHILRIPVVLHEANAVLGAANRFLARGAVAVALSHATDDWTLSIPYIVTGNPVRQDIVALTAHPYPLMMGDIHVLVVGGSLGAAVFADIIPAALLHLPEALRRRVRLVQQISAERHQAVQAVYDQAGIRAELAPFFTDMPDRIAACHLFIGRSGATTVAELAVAGRPAIFIPYPHHADQQQLKNTAMLVQAGAAWAYPERDLHPDQLTAQLQVLIENPDILLRAANAAKGCGQPDATAHLAHIVTGATK